MSLLTSTRDADLTALHFYLGGTDSEFFRQVFGYSICTLARIPSHLTIHEHIRNSTKFRIQ